MHMHMYLNMIFLSVCPVAALHVACAGTLLTTWILVAADHGRTLAHPRALSHTVDLVLQIPMKAGEITHKVI